VRIRTILAEGTAGQVVVVTGWIRTSRFSKNVSFLNVGDGSTPKTLQIVLPADTAEALKARLGVGAAVRVEGTVVVSPGAEQAFEVAASRVEVVGDSDASAYPRQKKATSLEFLRTVAHLRPRSNTADASRWSGS
jgi:asparaginyl-tRNA synthetase